MKKKQIKMLTPMEIDQLVKIQGTQYDRKRKLTDKDIKRITKLLASDVGIEDIAAMYNVTVHTIKYNTDDDYRQHSIQIRSGKHYGETIMDMLNRAAYKRTLALKRKVRI